MAADASLDERRREQRLASRPVYTTRKHRAEDLVTDDVARNRFGKWDVVSKVTPADRYVNVHFEVGGEVLLRTVHLVDVQVVKPS